MRHREQVSWIQFLSEWLAPVPMSPATVDTSKREKEKGMVKTQSNGKELRAKDPDPAKELETWPEIEPELFREVLEAMRTIRYGSIVLTIHDGELVEVSKNIRIRRNKAEDRK